MKYLNKEKTRYNILPSRIELGSNTIIDQQYLLAN